MFLKNDNEQNVVTCQVCSGSVAPVPALPCICSKHLFFILYTAFFMQSAKNELIITSENFTMSRKTATTKDPS